MISVLKKLFALTLALLLSVSVLASCENEPAAEDAQKNESGVSVTTYTPDNFREKSSLAEKWAEENAPAEETETDKRYECDVITQDGVTYLLAVWHTSNGMADIYTDILEKHDNGTVSFLYSVNETALFDGCPIQLVRDGKDVILLVVGGENFSTWGDSGKISVTYQSGDTEVVEYSFTDEKVTDEMKSGREYRGFRCKFLHVLKGGDDIASMTFVSAPAPVKYGGVTTRVFELDENLTPVSAVVINSDGRFEETYVSGLQESGEQTGEEQAETTEPSQQFVSAFKYDLKKGMLSDFDIAFLKVENDKVNKVYSPLSIKYALKMLEEGAAGNSKAQIAEVMGDYEPPVYASNSNMAFANGLFVDWEFSDIIKNEYKKTLKNKYNAEVNNWYQSDPDYINSWVMRHTLGMIPEIIEEVDEKQDFFLVNALGIDMEWKYRFFDWYNRAPGFFYNIEYAHESYWASCNVETVQSRTFDNGTKKTKVSGMEFYASMDNYDIVKILGEENIRKTVGDAYREWIDNNSNREWYYDGNDFVSLTDPVKIEEEIARYLDVYIWELQQNYSDLGEALSVDFMLYVDDSVKAFAKDLAEYNGVQLQYVCVMPQNEDLDTYIENTDSDKINHIIDNLKELKREKFKDGVITRIQGFLPKFDFDYELRFIEDLEKIGITDIFDSSKADLSDMVEAEGEFINKALHKAKIELTQDGIKAAAVTAEGGLGSDGDGFDYIYEVPIEEIDLTFDRPFIFFVRDKETGEIWFTGTVYEPLKWADDRTREEYSFWG